MRAAAPCRPWPRKYRRVPRRRWRCRWNGPADPPGPSSRCPAVAAVPLHGEPRIGVEVRFLLPQHLVEGGVDEQQGVPHRHVGPVGLTHPRIPGEHRNTGTNGRLGQINRGDGPLHERPQSLRQLGFEPSDEQPAGDGFSLHRSRTAGQHYGRSEGIASDVAHPSGSLATYRPSGSNPPPRINEPIEQGVPTGR